MSDAWKPEQVWGPGHDAALIGRHSSIIYQSSVNYNRKRRLQADRGLLSIVTMPYKPVNKGPQ